jgi:serine/threonine protein kinase
MYVNNDLFSNLRIMTDFFRVSDIHKSGLMHRDIKPDNLLLQPTGASKQASAISPGFRLQVLQVPPLVVLFLTCFQMLLLVVAKDM